MRVLMGLLMKLKKRSIFFREAALMQPSAFRSSLTKSYMLDLGFSK